MTRYGTTIVFKRGVIPSEAAAALEKIKDVIDTDYMSPYPTIEMGELIHEFDEAEGGPVWYIP